MESQCSLPQETLLTPHLAGSLAKIRACLSPTNASELPSTLWGRLCDCAHSTDEKTEDCPAVPQLRRSRARCQRAASLPDSGPRLSLLYPQCNV